MSSRTINLSAPLYAYMLAHSLREPPAARRLRAETAVLPRGHMQISPEQAQFMAFLIKLVDARRILEIGTFTGYSALMMALALPVEGELVTCDISEEWTAIAKQAWQDAGVSGRIQLRLAPANETLDALIAQGQCDTFDLAFIDADKTNYVVYFERSLSLVRLGGLIMIDNVLWGGRVIDDDAQDDDTQAIRAFNAALKDDPRIDLSVLPIGDGLTLARRREASAP